MEPLYCGHFGDLVKCPVYSGTPLLWTLWGPGEVSCIQWNPSIVDTLGTWRSVLYREVSSFRDIKKAYLGHSQVSSFQGYPYFRGVLISGVSFKRGFTDTVCGVVPCLITTINYSNNNSGYVCILRTATVITSSSLHFYSLDRSVLLPPGSLASRQPERGATDRFRKATKIETRPCRQLHNVMYCRKVPRS